MYTKNDRNIFIVTDLWLIEEYFQQIEITLDNLHYLFSDSYLSPFYHRNGAK